MRNKLFKSALPFLLATAGLMGISSAHAGPVRVCELNASTSACNTNALIPPKGKRALFVAVINDGKQGEFFLYKQGGSVVVYKTGVVKPKAPFSGGQWVKEFTAPGGQGYYAGARRFKGDSARVAFMYD